MAVLINSKKMVPLGLFTKNLVIELDLPSIQPSTINVHHVFFHSSHFSKSTLLIMSTSYCKHPTLALRYNGENNLYRSSWWPLRPSWRMHSSLVQKTDLWNKPLGKFDSPSQHPSWVMTTTQAVCLIFPCRSFPPYQRLDPLHTRESNNPLFIFTLSTSWSDLYRFKRD